MRDVVANVGHGNPRLYYNVFTQRNASHFAQVFVHLKTLDREVMAGLLERLRVKAERYPGARIEVKELEQGPGTMSPITLRVLGPNLDVLRALSAQVAGLIEAQPGTVNVDDPLALAKSDLKVEINRDKAAQYGVALSEIDLTVRAAMTGVTVDVFQDDQGKDYDIVARLPLDGGGPKLSDFDRINVASRSGRLGAPEAAGVSESVTQPAVGEPLSDGAQRGRHRRRDARRQRGQDHGRHHSEDPGPVVAQGVPPLRGRRAGEPERVLRRHGPRHRHRGHRHLGRAGAPVPLLRAAPHRLLGHSLGHYRVDSGPALDRQFLQLHGLCGAHQPGGHRGQQRHHLGGLHQPAPRRGLLNRRGPENGGTHPLHAHHSHNGHHHRRALAPDPGGRHPLGAHGMDHHRRPALLDAIDPGHCARALPPLYAGGPRRSLAPATGIKNNPLTCRNLSGGFVMSQ